VGSHTHNPDFLTSKVALDYAKDKTVKGEVTLKNKGDDDKLKMSGDGSLSFPGQLAAKLHRFHYDSLQNKIHKKCCISEF
jgi:hypothetical protein